MAREEPVKRCVRHRQPRPGQLDTQFIQRDVLRRVPYSQYPVAMRLDPPRARVAAPRLGGVIPEGMNPDSRLRIPKRLIV